MFLGHQADTKAVFQDTKLDTKAVSC